MPNYRFTILIMQGFSRYYLVHIRFSALRFIFKGCIPDNEEGQSFCKLNAMECSRVFYIFFSIFRVAISEFMTIYLFQGLFSKIRTNTKHNLTKIALFKEIGALYFIWGSFRKKAILSLHFNRNSSGKWMHIFPRLMAVMLRL